MNSTKLHVTTIRLPCMHMEDILDGNPSRCEEAIRLRDAEIEIFKRKHGEDNLVKEFNYCKPGS